MEAKRDKQEPTPATAEAATPRLVYTHAPVLMGKLVEPTDRGWRVDLGALARDLPVDAAVDPQLLQEAHARGARVIVDAAAEPTIVGVVATWRAISIDREGRVDEELTSLKVSAQDEILLRIPGAFLRARRREVEVYGERVITRARDVAKILAAMIKLN